VKAIVLAAGKGERLEPLTLTRPKHMISVGGKPALEWLLQALKEVEIRDVLIVTSYKEDNIRRYFRDGSDFGLRLSYITQKQVVGTAPAIGEAREYVGDEDFLAVYGDLLVSDTALRSIIAETASKESRMAVVRVNNPSLYGVVEVEGGLVTSIVEKPKVGEAPSNLANAGIYFLKPDIFPYIKNMAVSPRGEVEFTDSLQRYVKDRRVVRASIISGEDWLDIGHLWNILDANERVLRKLNRRTEGEIEEGVHILGPVVVEKDAKIRSGAYLEGPVLIGERSDIGPNCYIRPCTSIGKDVRIGNSCEIKNSIIMDRTHVAHLSYIGDSVIGSDCNFGAGTTTANVRFDRRNISVVERGRKLDTGKKKLGTFMGDDVQTGVNVSLMPGVKIGPGSWIAPGLCVYEDIPPETFLTLERPRLESKSKSE